MNKATVYRLMSELQESGLIEQLPEQRGYRLGTEVLRLAKLRESAVPMLDVGREILQELSDATGETTHMSLVQGDQLVETAHVYSAAHATRVIMDDAEILSFHGTSSGLAILAYSEDAFVEHILGMDLVAHTPNTLTDVTSLRQKISQIAQQGYAEYDGGYEAEVHSHAAPLFDAHGKPIGAIAVAAPANRVDADVSAKTVELLRKAANRFTRQTGGQPPETLT